MYVNKRLILFIRQIKETLNFLFENRLNLHSPRSKQSSGKIVNKPVFFK